MIFSIPVVPPPIDGRLPGTDPARSMNINVNYIAGTPEYFARKHHGLTRMLGEIPTSNKEQQGLSFQADTHHV